jgi:hypothetical protein
MKHLEHLNLKPSHFNNGVASFDQVSHTDIIKATSSGAEYDPTDINNLIVIDVITNYKELMAFGIIDQLGIMYFQGFSGFPFDSKCVDHVDNLIPYDAKKRKINHCNIFVEL